MVQQTGQTGLDLSSSDSLAELISPIFCNAELKKLNCDGQLVAFRDDVIKPKSKFGDGGGIAVGVGWSIWRSSCTGSV